MGLLGSDIIANLTTPKLNTPEFKKIDIGQVQKDTIEGNIKATPLLSELTRKAQEIGIEQGQRDIETAFNVAGQGSLSNIQGILSQLMSGEIPQDVVDQIRRRAAERGYGSGTAGSGFNRNLEARDLGLTSLDLIQRGLQGTSALASTALSRIPQFNAAAMFVDPVFATQFEQSERDKKFQVDWMQEQLDVEQSFGAAFGRAAQSFDEAITQMAISFVGSAAGGMMGGGGGGGATGSPPPNTHIEPGGRAINTYGIPGEYFY